MNPSELNYQVVSTFEHNAKRNNMEPGKKYRQFMAGIIGEHYYKILYILCKITVNEMNNN